jgi:hypothetical protein
LILDLTVLRLPEYNVATERALSLNDLAIDP